MQPTHHHHTPTNLTFNNCTCTDDDSTLVAGPKCYDDHAQPAARRWRPNWWRRLRTKKPV